jgi:hypothetical protein
VSYALYVQAREAAGGGGHLGRRLGAQVRALLSARYAQEQQEACRDASEEHAEKYRQVDHAFHLPVRTLRKPP